MIGKIAYLPCTQGRNPTPAEASVVRQELIRSVQASEEAVRLARTRYLEGLSNYNEVLEAQQRLYPAQLALAQTEINRRLVDHLSDINLPYSERARELLLREGLPPEFVRTLEMLRKHR